VPVLKTWIRWLLCAAGATVGAAGIRPIGAARLAVGNPFEFFAPWVVISDSEKRRLERDEVVVRVLHGGDGQLAVFVATRLKAPPDALAAWTRAIAELKRSRFVLAVGRFSEPPTTADLEDLSVDDAEVEAIRECVPGNCALKLSAPEMMSLKAAAASGGSAWRDAVQREFRRVLVARVDAYRARGLAGLGPSADRETPRPWDLAFSAVVAKSPYLTRIPAVAAWLQGYPSVDDPRIESFFYWSKEYYGGGKPVISVTHVGIVRPEPNRHLPAVLVAGKQLFATHYVEGGLGLTLVTRDGANGEPYLVYVNRSQLDLLRGFFGGLARSVLESRLKRHAPQIVRGLRTRLESGTPRGSGRHGAIRLGRKTPVGGASRMCCSKLYALIMYSCSMRCAVKNEPFNAIA
jgi:hypothetical protein